MGVPEMVIQEGLERSWKALQENSFVLGHIFREMSAPKQQEWQRIIEEETPAFHFGYPTSKVLLPAVSILLLNEDEGIQVIGDVGLQDRDMPFPAVAPGDYAPQEEFYGITYGDDQSDPDFLGVEGELSVLEPTNHPLPRKNLDIQDLLGDEQYERLGEVQKLWHRERQRLGARAVTDTLNVGLLITTDNAEKTFLYFRLVRTLMRAWSTWFHINGLQNPKFSGTELSPVETLLPSASGGPVFQRQLNMMFMYEDRTFEVESVLLGWLLQIELLTKRQDGTFDSVTALTATGDVDPRGSGV